MHFWLHAAICSSMWARIALADCETESTMTVANSDDATALASCTTFTGSIALATDISGDIALDGVVEIIGNVYVGNASELTSFSGDYLLTIGGNLTLEDVQTLHTFNFTELTSVGNVLWSSLPNLQSLSIGFDQGLSADRVEIYNTHLQSLNISNATSITIVNNANTVSISIAVNNVTDSLVIENNNPNMTVDLPNLYWANNITLSNVSAVHMPLLNAIDSNLNIYGSTMDSVEIPNLNIIRGGLSLIGNRRLTSIQIPSVVQVGYLEISNNTELRSLALDELGIISSTISIDGNLTNVSMPSVTSVGDSFEISSTDQTFDCDVFDSYKSNDIIHGQYSCNGTHTNRLATDAASSAVQSGGLTPGVKASIGVGVSLALITMLLMGAYIWRLKSKQKKKRAEDTAEGEEKKIDIVGEMDADAIIRTELGNGKEAQELPDAHGVSEAGGGRKVREIPGTHELPP